MFSLRIATVLALLAMTAGCGSPLIRAINDDDADRLRSLLKEGYDVNERESSIGATAVYHAAYLGRAELVDILLQHNADVEMPTDDGWTPLYMAAQNGHDEVVSLLLEEGANVNNDRAPLRRTPLIGAVCKNRVKISEELLKAGANVDARTDDQFTPLILAAYHDHTEIVRLLLDAGANPDAAQKSGFASLHYAAERGSTGTMSLLLAAGADTEVCTKKRLTPLNSAALGGSREAFELLLRHGAQPNEAPLLHEVTAKTFVFLAERYELEGDRSKAREAYETAARHLEEEAAECRKAVKVLGQQAWNDFWVNMVVDVYAFAMAGFPEWRGSAYGLAFTEQYRASLEFWRTVGGRVGAKDPRESTSFGERATACEELAAYCRQKSSTPEAGQ
jgi:ankyrin repeat protein